MPPATPQPAHAAVSPDPASGGDERAFLAWVRRRQEASLAGNCPGDDLAVLAWPGGLLLLGIDPLLDGVHINLALHGPAAAGRKAMNRNLSDVAAMAGEPVAAIVSLVVPRSLSLDAVQQIYLGAEQAGREAGCPIVGGDFATWDGPLVVTVGILGRTEQTVLREGAAPGDHLHVTGPLGGSILGRHLTFNPRLDMGLRAARRFGASAMIDLSDGLSLDLPRLLGTAVGATIDAAAIPVHPDAVRLATQSGREALWHALNDGEDYELLFAAKSAELPGCVRIGQAEAEPGVRLKRGDRLEPLIPAGWEHRLAGPNSPR